MPRSAAVSIGAALLLASSIAHADVQQCLDASEQGQKLRDEGKLTQARDLFRVCSATTCPAPVRKSCVKWHEQAVESLPSIIVVARNEKDVDVVGASVTIDGGKAEPITGRGIPIDPGSHTVAVHAKGHADGETKVVVNINEKNRTVKVTLTPTGGPPSTAEPITPPRVDEPRPPDDKRNNKEPSTPQVETGMHPTPLTFVFGGVAVASVAGSLVLGFTTRAARDDLGCAKTSTCTDDDTSGLRTRFIIADVLLGVGIVAAAAAVYTFVTSSPSRTSFRGFTF